MTVDLDPELCEPPVNGPANSTDEKVKSESDSFELGTSSNPQTSGLRRLARVLKAGTGFEERGIARVPSDERQPPSLAGDVQIALLWFGINLSCNNIIVGLYGPVLFQLGFLDSAMCAVFGAFLGSLSTGYMATWGPKSGNRTMVVMRYFFGWWPAKLPTILNIILMVGYCTIDGIFGGQILSAVGGNSMSISVGIVVVNLVCWLIVLLGMKPFQYFERYAWIPQVLVLFILIGCTGPSFDASLVSVGNASTVAANRLSFLSMCLYLPNSWTAAASDFYVYYPEKTSSVKVFMLTVTGLWISFILVFMIGIGIGTGLAANVSWATAFDTSAGTLIVAAFEPLQGFGKFCSVIIALGLISNSVPGTYSATMCAQVLGRYFQAIPRWIWACFFTIVELSLGLGGKNSLYTILSNFLALMGYWIEFMTLIVLMEKYIFRRSFEYDWSKWQDRSAMPVGIAACVSFLLGWMGAILGMNQTWYVGPLAKLAKISDVGVWVGMAFTLVSFPPLRYMELSRLRR